jgi:geranylgeranyl pyrophosphate synthase
VAYHLANDVRDLLGDNSRPGNREKQELGGHRLTLPLVLAAEQADGDVRAQLEQMVAVKEVSPQQMEAAREIAASTGAIEDAWRVVHSWLDAARQELALLPDGAAKHALLTLASSQARSPAVYQN